MYLVESDVKEYIALLFIVFSSLYESFFNKKSLKKSRIKITLGFILYLILKKSWS